MAITFPRAIPDEFSGRLTGMTFILKPSLEITPLRSGRKIAKDLGPSIWLAEWNSSRLEPSEFGIVRAWIDSLSSINELFGYDKAREYPLAYASGFTGGFGGTCTLTSVTLPYTIVLGTLPASFVLSPGDYLSFDYNSGTSRALHRVVEGGTASGGGALTVEVRPEVRPGYAGGATVTLYRASARMLIVPDSYNEIVSGAGAGTVSFKAVQTL